MPISDVAAEYILNRILVEILLSGQTPSITTITDTYNTFITGRDLSQPLFSTSDFTVTSKEPASASLYNSMNQSIQQDLVVLFRHLFRTSDQAMINFERWKTECKFLEGQLDSLTDRIQNLLLTTQNIEGYFSYVQDNFVDTSKIDLTYTNTFINLAKNILCIDTVNSFSRIDLSSLQSNSVNFTVLTRNNLVSQTSAEGSKPVYSISDKSNYWQERVWTLRPGVLSAELKVKLPIVSPLSRIDLTLHMSNQNGPVEIIPMYSIDNHSWKNLPIDSYSRSITNSTSFQFSSVDAQWIKIIFTKSGPDGSKSGLYNYEFGLDELALYNQGYSSTLTSTFISQPLSIVDNKNIIQSFNKVALDVCEDRPSGTDIQYYIAPMTDSTTSVGSLVFTAIDPISRISLVNPDTLNFGDSIQMEIPDIGISYSVSGGSGFVSPASAYDVLSSVSLGEPVLTTGPVIAYRYSFLKGNEFLLSLSIDPAVKLAEGSIELWRNVLQSSGTVRNLSTGWKFEDPYYKTTILVKSFAGQNVDWGSNPIVLDGTIVSGKTNITQGNHSIWVHTNNWEGVTSDLADLDLLKAGDPLYPYNHRYLVEGYSYPSSWLTTTEKVYKGFDVVAESLMKEISIFDLAYNIKDTDYTKFARDLDIQDPALSVFVIKADNTISDFPNEKFLLRFKSSDLPYSYIRLKAVLTSESSLVTPSFTGYRIKVSG